MSLLAEIQKHSARRGPSCTMVAVEAALSVKDRTELRTAYTDTGVTHAAIFRALKARGLPVTETGVIRHRKGECSCEKP